MYNCIEVTMWLVFGLIWYQGSYFVFKKQPKVTISNDELIKYNNVLNEYYYNEFLYKNTCKNTNVSINEDNIGYGYKNGCMNLYYSDVFNYEAFWENNVENGFVILRNKNLIIKGYKKNNLYDGLVRFYDDTIDNNNLNSLDCVYENGKKNVCYFIDKNNNIKHIVPERIHKNMHI